MKVAFPLVESKVCKNEGKGMKKWIIALVLLISCSGILPIHASNWYWIARDMNNGHWYIDASSVRKEYGNSTVWMKWEFPNGNYMVSQMEITKSRTATELQYTMYNPRGEVIYYHIFESWEKRTISIPPDSILDIAYRAIWG